MAPPAGANLLGCGAKAPRHSSNSSGPFLCAGNGSARRISGADSDPDYLCCPDYSLYSRRGVDRQRSSSRRCRSSYPHWARPLLLRQLCLLLRQRHWHRPPLRCWRHQRHHLPLRRLHHRRRPVPTRQNSGQLLRRVKERTFFSSTCWSPCWDIVHGKPPPRGLFRFAQTEAIPFVRSVRYPTTNGGLVRTIS
jgi:hypothetical protein